MLKIRNIEAGYGKLRVLKGVSLHVAPGETVALIGPNGAGKTTLLKTISGLIRPMSGEIFFGQKKISGSAPAQIVTAGLAQVPEGRQVFAPLTVRENIMLGAYTRKDRNNFAGELEYIFELFPILKERYNQLAGTLSGGEQQMLAFARVLMSKPALVLMDEPSMGLAPLMIKKIYEAISLLKKTGTTFLIVEQNARLALKISDRGYVIETGQIVINESSGELLNNKEVQRAYLGKEYKRIND